MSSRKEEKERRRQERLAQEQAQDEQSRRRRLYSIVAGGVLVVAAGAAIVAVAAGGGGGDGGNGNGGSTELEVEAIAPPPQRMDDLVQAARAANCALTNPVIEGREHTTESVEYKTNPPNSGSHDPVPAEDGAYGRSPDPTNLVHSLEHGRVIVHYDPTLSRQRIGQLKGLFDADPYHIILTPNNTDMPYAVAVAAWGHVAGCKRATDETFDVIRTFSERYRDKGPEFVP